MSTEPSSATSRKRKLPSCLGLTPGTKVEHHHIQQPVAKKPATANNHVKMIRTTPTAATTTAISSTSNTPISVLSPSPTPKLASGSTPSAISTALTSVSSPSAKSISISSPVVTSSAIAPINFTSTRVVSTTATPILSTRPLPPVFKSPPAPFPFLELPLDLLSVISSFCWIWDAFFLRCTCSMMRTVSGLNGGVVRPILPSTHRQSPFDRTKEETKLKRRLSHLGSIRHFLSPQTSQEETQPIDSPSSPLSPPSVSVAASLSLEPPPVQPMDVSENQLVANSSHLAPTSNLDDAVDDHRFWHHYTSLDFRQILLGWRQFESMRVKIIKEMRDGGVIELVATDGVPISSSASPSPTANTIMFFDSDEEARISRPTEEESKSDLEEDSEPAIRMRGTRSSRRGRTSSSIQPVSSNQPVSAAATNSPRTSIKAVSQPQVDVYTRLHRVIAPFMFGSSRSRSVSSSQGSAEDVSTSSDEDVWLLHFLSTHRFPFIQHLHFGYVTLHSSLLQHLQTFCCNSTGADFSGTVREISVQYSSKSIGRWLDTLMKGFGRLEILSLDLSGAVESFSLSPLLRFGSSLTRLHLIGSTSWGVALPPNILDSLSAALPLLRHLTIVHGLLTDDAHLEKSMKNITEQKRWKHLRMLHLAQFPSFSQSYTLISHLTGCPQLKRLDIQACIRIRLPNILLPKKPTSTKKGKNNAVDSDSPPNSPKPSKSSSSDLTLPVAAVCRLPSITTCNLSQCSSLTAPSLRALAVMFPNLHTLQLNGYESKMMGGSALKLLLDPLVFTSLTSLSLSDCPHLDDGAWESLPKKTRMTHLRTLNISLSHPAHIVTSKANTLIKKGGDLNNLRFTDYGLKMLMVYCPNISNLNLSGRTDLTPTAILKLVIQLPYLERLSLLNLSLDGAWLLQLSQLPVPHSFSISLSLTPHLIRTANVFLNHTPSSASGTQTSTFPSVSNLLSTTSSGRLLRSVLIQQLQDHMTSLTHQRVRLVVQV